MGKVWYAENWLLFCWMSFWVKGMVDVILGFTYTITLPFVVKFFGTFDFHLAIQWPLFFWEIMFSFKKTHFPRNGIKNVLFKPTAWCRVWGPCLRLTHRLNMATRALRGHQGHPPALRGRMKTRPVPEGWTGSRLSFPRGCRYRLAPWCDATWRGRSGTIPMKKGKQVKIISF